MSLKNKGFIHERHARFYLEKKGLLLVCEEYTCPFGEIDLIMQKKQFLHMVEVKYRKKMRDIGEMVPPSKQQKIMKTARHFVQSYPRFNDFFMQFDCIFLTDESIYYLPNAFESDF